MVHFLNSSARNFLQNHQIHEISASWKFPTMCMVTQLWSHIHLTYSVCTVWNNFYSISLRCKTTLSNNVSNFYRVSTSPPIRCTTTHYTLSLLWGRTATKHWDRGVVMWLITSQELVVGLYMWIAVVCHSDQTLPACKPGLHRVLLMLGRVDVGGCWLWTIVGSLCPSLQQYSVSFLLLPVLLSQPETCQCTLQQSHSA